MPVLPGDEDQRTPVPLIGPLPGESRAISLAGVTPAYAAVRTLEPTTDIAAPLRLWSASTGPQRLGRLAGSALLPVDAPS